MEVSIPGTTARKLTVLTAHEILGSETLDALGIGLFSVTILLLVLAARARPVDRRARLADLESLAGAAEERGADIGPAIPHLRRARRAIRPPETEGG